MIRNRKEIEQLVYNTFDALDPSGTNTAKYREYYSSLSDAQFEKHMKDFLKNPDENFILDTQDFEHSVKMDYCERAAKVLGIPLMEYVYLPHLTMDKKRVIVSKEKCLVGWINVKRTQQLLHKKNGLAVSDESRYHLTGQVTGEDKDARDSDIEATMLVSLGAEHILQELHGPRSDDLVMNREMMDHIATKQHVQLDELTNSPTNKVTLNTVNAYFLGMQIKSDIVVDSYVLPSVLAEIFD